MQNNRLHDNPLVFWVGLVLIFAGLIGAWLYIIGPHIAFFGPGRHIKHGLVAIAVAVAGVVIASFARPRGSAISDSTGFNR